jgi:glucosamine--fructose-6-phosphate aminotransferase (isomerizing)
VQDLHLQMPEADWDQVVACALQLVEGAYGVVFLFQDEPDLLIGARKGSPLILGVGTGEYMLASDASAIIEHTQDVVYLREGELVRIKRSGYTIMSTDDVAKKAMLLSQSPRKDDGSIDNPIVRLNMSLEQIEKGGYAHFMLKEIMDQPNALRNAMRGRLHQPAEKENSWQIKLGGLEKVPEVPNGRSALQRMATGTRIIICACGTSWHSGLIAKYAFESLAQIPVEVEYASEFRYRKPIISKDDVIIAISQSGETADTLEAIRIAKQHEALTIGVVNVVGSSIARMTDAGVYLHAGPEIGVASTKAFTGQVLALSMIALKLAVERGVLSEDDLDKYGESLNQVPQMIEDWLPALDKQVKVIAKYFRLASNALFCGCGIHFPVSLEGALKLKEISYIHAEGFPASEIKHGPLTLVKNFIPVIAIAMRSDPAYKTIKENIKELRARDGALIILTDEGNEDFRDIASFVIHCPCPKLEFEPLVTVVPLQLLSYHIAELLEVI